MLGLGWTEMLVIGVVALIVIGPKDLPVVMNRIGKIAGQIRRMGNEFQREINKTTGLDEVRNLRNSITAPLKKTSDEIRKEFNAMTPTGPKPSGALKPADPKTESVVDEIKAAAGMTPPKATGDAGAKAGPASKASTARTRKPAARKAPVKAKAAPTRPVIATDLAPLDAPAPARKPAASSKPAAKKPAAKATPTKKPTKAAAAAEASPAPKKRAAARPKSAARPKPAATEAAKAGDA